MARHGMRNADCVRSQLVHDIIEPFRARVQGAVFMMPTLNSLYGPVRPIRKSQYVRVLSRKRISSRGASFCSRAQTARRSFLQARKGAGSQQSAITTRESHVGSRQPIGAQPSRTRATVIAKLPISPCHWVPQALRNCQNKRNRPFMVQAYHPLTFRD